MSNEWVDEIAKREAARGARAQLLSGALTMYDTWLAADYTPTEAKLLIKGAVPDGLWPLVEHWLNTERPS